MIDINIWIKRSQSEGCLFYKAKRLKEFGIPFTEVNYEIRENRLYILFTVENWSAELARHPYEGIKGLQYSVYDDKKRNKPQLAFYAN